MSSSTSQAAAIRAAVQRCYRLARTDPRLAPHFAGQDVEALADRLTASLIRISRTGDRGRPADLVAGHRRLGLDEDTYDLLGHLLLTTLLPLRLGPDLLIQVGALLSEARPQVVARTADRDDRPAIRPAAQPGRGAARR